MSVHRIHIPVDLGGTYLPVVHNSFLTEHQHWAIVPQMRLSLAYSILSKLDVFGYQNSTRSLWGLYISSELIEIEFEFKHHYSHFCGNCVRASANQKIYGLQKELLIWHWRPVVIMYCIEEFMNPCAFEEPNDNRTILPEIIYPKFPAAKKRFSTSM